MNSLEMIGDYVRHLEEENSELQQKIDKAIEYIKSEEIDIIPSELLEILRDKQYEEYTLTKDEENGTKLINGEWYRVEKIN